MAKLTEEQIWERVGRKMYEVLAVRSQLPWSEIEQKKQRIWRKRAKVAVDELVRISAEETFPNIASPTQEAANA